MLDNLGRKVMTAVGDLGHPTTLTRGSLASQPVVVTGRRNVRIDQLLEELPTVAFDAQQVVDCLRIELRQRHVTAKPRKSRKPGPIVRAAYGKIVGMPPVFLAP